MREKIREWNRKFLPYRSLSTPRSAPTHEITKRRPQEAMLYQGVAEAPNFSPVWTVRGGPVALWWTDIGITTFFASRKALCPSGMDGNLQRLCSMT